LAGPFSYWYNESMNRQTRLAVIAALCLVVLAAMAADAPPTKPKVDAGPQRVTVTKVGGKALAGLLKSTDLDGIHLTYGPKAEVLDIPWSDIKSISNGLTREKYVATWKTEHADKLCDKCHGDRFLPCPECKGTGIDPKQHKECVTCKGTGSTGACTTPGCKEGKVDCPKPCLKLSVGQWKLVNGMKIREFKTADGKGTAWWSEHHLGELIVMENGTPTNKGPCPTCGGTGKLDDPACKGTGKKLCTECKGNGFTGPACPSCDQGHVKCDECKGTGLKAGAT
jgi:hypothetical protein